MSRAILIPFRGPAGAKSRLAEVLSENERARLALLLMRRVGRVAISAEMAPVVVVAPCGPALDEASALGARTIVDTSGTLNGALVLARDRLVVEGVTTLAVIAADLAALGRDDVATLVDAGRGGLALAPDAAGTGTNALAIGRRLADFRFAFGPDSAALHRAEALRLGLPLTIVNRRGLAADLDTPSDLAVLAPLLDAGDPAFDDDLRRALQRALGRNEAGQQGTRHA